MSDPLSKFIAGSPAASPVPTASPVAEISSVVRPLGRPEPTPGMTPGQMIREARDYARLNLQELANTLRLPLSTLDALERDDFQTLSQPVYVRGYYRRCGKLLGIDENLLLTAYDKLAPASSAVPPQRYTLAKEESERRLPIRGLLLILATVAVLVVAVMMWLRHAATPSNDQTETSLLSAPQTVDATPSVDTSATAPVTAANTDGAARKATAISQPAAPAPRATVYDTLVKPLSDAPAKPAMDAAEKPSAAPSKVATVTRPAPATSISAPGSAETATDLHALTLVVRNTSWVRIEDSTSKLLYVGTIKGGNRQDLIGRPPYQLFIGNAAGVDVEYGGDPIDIKPYIRENATARVTIPAASSESSVANVTVPSTSQ